MSAGILGAIAGVGPGLTEGLNAKELRASSKSERTIAEAQEGRAAEEHGWRRQLGDMYQYGRNAVDNPDLWKQYFSDPQGFINMNRNQVGPMSPVPPGGSPPLLPTEQDVSYQEGGAINVPAQPPMALSSTPVAGTPSQGPLPGERPAGGGMSRRERYDHWYGQMSRLAFLNEGLQGVREFDEMENAMSRRQVLGYALQAVRALDEGNVGEAMRAGNSALEVTPFDTGLSFEAADGNLYMVGADGMPGEPLKANHLRAFIDDHMKTPESYLAWRQQYETERRNQVDESLRGRGMAVQEGYLDIQEEMLPANQSKIGAEIYSLITNADANSMRANAAGDTPGLSNADRTRINNDIPTLIQNAKIDPGSQWWGAMTQNPAVAASMKSAAIDTAMMNLMSGQGNYADAIGLAAFAFAPAAGIEVPQGVRIQGIGIEGEGDNARAYANFNDKKIYIPPSMFAVLRMQRDALTGEGDGGALPGSARMEGD